MFLPKNSCLSLPHHGEHGELRLFWSCYKHDPDVRRLILEVQRSRRAIEEIRYFHGSIQNCWREEGQGQLVAMEKLRLLSGERMRGAP